MKLVFLSEAEADIDSAYSFFLNTSLEYAEHFQICLASDFSLLQKNFGWHPQHFNCYRALSERFRTSIYYLIRPDHLLIVAILDQRFSPSKIKEILTARSQKL